jgi:ATP-dependent DNA helicase DinG
MTAIGTETRNSETHELPEVTELLGTAVAALGGTDREGQQRMAEAVARAIAIGEHLAVQAGTGTGKSLAYLVPAVRHAVAKDSTVVVSTSTIALQRQLIERDLPRLASALAAPLGRAPTFAILKGRRNYLCLNRLESGPEEPAEAGLFEASATSKTARTVARIHEWAQATSSGDRDELVPGVSETAWRAVSVSGTECMGMQRCPHGLDCFAERARAAAGRADVVVTNHALLAIDALEGYQVLPEHDVVVLDEAHDLVDRVTSVATGELSAPGVTAALRRCARLVGEEVADPLGKAGDELSGVLAGMDAGRLDTLSGELATALGAVAQAARSCLTSLGTVRDEPSTASAQRMAEAALDELHEAAARVLAAFDGGISERREVVWVCVEPERDPAVRVAPLSVAGLLRERLFARSTAVLTSATLALGGGFETMAASWGLPLERSRAQSAGASATATEAPAEETEIRWSGIDVGSPFAHARSGILYVAKHLPPPGRDGPAPQMLEELAGLIEAAGGRTLGLFSSARAAGAAAEALAAKTEVPILCQGADATSALLSRFAAEEQTCLFGTLSLWQGVDVPGPSLQLVVLDRLPFPRPDDPLTSARARAEDARGGNGFLSISAAHAALLLAQGTGRLLRTTHDRGVVAVLDSRLATARYAGFLRASLPPFWPTTDPALVRAALRRLDAAG